MVYIYEREGMPLRHGKVVKTLPAFRWGLTKVERQVVPDQCESLFTGVSTWM